MDTLPCGCTVTVDKEGFSNLHPCIEHEMVQDATRRAVKMKQALILPCGCNIHKQMFSDIYRVSQCDEHMRFYEEVNKIFQRNNQKSGLSS